MDPVLNISAYLFTPISDREQLRTTLLARADAAGLRGTVLLAPEGINMFLAGGADELRGFLDALREDARFAALEAKESWSATQPFRKMLVKLKNEIIRMDHPTIRPAAGRAPAVPPLTLKRWLDQGHDDEGREVVLLDTRNAFEVSYGTFSKALDWKIDKFTEFPDAVRRNRAALEGRTVVSFCTGGIRCEKAALFMQDEGLDGVLQLEGGILKYFEEVGGDHYDGDCFVFDDREALTPTLDVWEQQTRREPRRSALAG
ncbi:sulfurtransferase [Nocardioides daphniae]|uniref:tRNA uridine(34) hydroxylase n=1 Tax=Nocardioides daphniae TaxID=402297 RepID=A0A4P7UHI2_9ACTN|nr:sulfurtransferase [Nocardioides daphniae]